jgi:hypothetical protein
VTTRNNIFCDAMLIVCLAYSSTLKKEALFYPETSVNTGLHGVTPHRYENLKFNVNLLPSSGGREEIPLSWSRNCDYFCDGCPFRSRSGFRKWDFWELSEIL